MKLLADALVLTVLRRGPSGFRSPFPPAEGFEASLFAWRRCGAVADVPDIATLMDIDASTRRDGLFDLLPATFISLNRCYPTLLKDILD